MSYHLKLVKALSYYGPVKATKEHPDVFVEDEAIARAAVASGYFRMVTGEPEPMEPEPEREPYTREQLEDMTLEQLKEIASEVGVVETKGFKKADFVNAILWAEGDYSNGSPTMIDLQES